MKNKLYSIYTFNTSNPLKLIQIALLDTLTDFKLAASNLDVTYYILTLIG